LTTVSLPLLASVGVVAIFLASVALRSVQLRGGCGFDREGAVAAVRTWLHERRHLATLLVSGAQMAAAHTPVHCDRLATRPCLHSHAGAQFVSFLAYMPIMSASLKALDCVDPIDGVTYLRQDLNVPCGEGQHAAARIIAYTVLPLFGMGFPAVIAVLLVRSTPAQLDDAGFRSAWGFLYSGYRTLRLEQGGGGVVSSTESAATTSTAAGALCGRLRGGWCGAVCTRNRV